MGRRETRIRVTVTLPRRLVDEARAVAGAGRMSALLAEALERYLISRRQMAALDIGFGAWKDEDHPELKTPEDTVAYLNSIRGRSHPPAEEREPSP